MSATALLYPSGIVKCPWQYRKIDGTWHRRPVNTNGKWQKLRVERIGWPPDRGGVDTNTAQSPSIYKWHWDEQR
jgi:hypothetical protein